MDLETGPGFEKRACLGLHFEIDPQLHPLVYLHPLLYRREPGRLQDFYDLSLPSTLVTFRTLKGFLQEPPMECTLPCGCGFLGVIQWV